MADVRPTQLCSECVLLDPVRILRTGEMPAREWHKISSQRNCPFCTFCIRVCFPCPSAYEEACKAKNIVISLQLHRGQRSTDSLSGCGTKWLSVHLLDPKATRKWSRPGKSFSFQEIQPPQEAEHNEPSRKKGRRIQDKIDLSLLRTWMSQCSNNHGSDCEDPPRAPAIKPPAYLIDTSRRILISNKEHRQFAALSYAYGDPTVPQLKLSNLHQSEPNKQIWDLANYWERIPQTIKDAMRLSELLSIPYLWVDSLCVSLEQRPSKGDLCSTLLARQMRDVYEAAQITIVAAAGQDSWAGLPGLRAGTRRVRQYVADLGTGLLANFSDNLDEVMKTSYWNTRAWTFQESFLSKRMLIFGEAQCFWNCNWGTLYEDGHGEVRDIFDNVKKTNLRGVKQHLLSRYNVSNEEYFDMYRSIVRDYTSRNLTYQQDALEAFSGVASFLGQHMRTVFMFGIPVEVFEQALLFDVPCGWTRRPEFPSWSWVGWSCPADSHAAITYSEVRLPNARRNSAYLRSMATWHAFDMGAETPEVAEHIETENKAPTASSVSQASQEHTDSFELSWEMHELTASFKISHSLLVETEKVHLAIRSGCHDVVSGKQTITLHFPGNDKVMCTLSVDEGWNQRKPETYAFIAITRETRGVRLARFGEQQSNELTALIHALLVEEGPEGVVERVRATTVYEADWKRANPVYGIVVMV